VSLGSVATAVLWVFGSVFFSIYVSNLGKYIQTYGSLAAIVILLLWFYLSAYAVLVGAEFKAETEHQARKVSNSDKRPMNNRKPVWGNTISAAHKFSRH
jgi:membrane protein